MGCAEALELLRGSDRIWAETKYDGERAQIHVEVQSDNSSHITIFSKSKRDSSQDRYAVHDIVRRALGLLSPNPQKRKEIKMIQVKHNVVLDAEMVAFRGVQVDGDTPVRLWKLNLIFCFRILAYSTVDRRYCTWDSRQKTCIYFKKLGRL